jgi:hypothetical protein
MLHSISTFLTRHKKALFLLGFALVFLCQFEPSFANTTDTTSNAGNVWLIDVIQGGLKIIASLLGVLTTLVALFLNPEWTSGTAFGLQAHLKEIWILVSNVVYFIFAMILIVIAFMNIIGKWENIWELKSALPRFIVGVLIVPFSWFFVQFVVSMSAILTIGVLTLPYDTFKDKDFFVNVNAKFPICIHPVIDLGSVDTTDLKQSYSCDTYATVWEILNGEQWWLKNGIFGIISIYTYGILWWEQMDQISKGQITSVEGAIKAIIDLGVKWIFDLVFVLVYCLLMFALFMALFVRGIWLWIYMMLSPAFWLLYFFEKWSDGAEGVEFSITKFISLALVPVYVCAALSFGLVFIFVASDGIGKSVEVTNPGSETLELAGLKLTIKWYQWKTEWGLMKWVGGALSTLIVEMFGIVILWIAVMAALKTSETTNAIVEPIRAFGNSVWSMVAKAPTYAPIIPVPGWQNQSAASLSNIGSSVTSAIQNKQSERSTSFIDKYIPSMSWGIDVSHKAQEALRSIQSQGFNKNTVEQIRDTMQAWKNSGEVLRNDKVIDLLKTALDRTNDEKNKEIAWKIDKNIPQTVLNAIQALHSNQEVKNNWGIVWWAIIGPFDTKEFDKRRNDGNTDETPAASTVTNKTTVDINVATWSFTEKREPEIIDALKTQIGANKITSTNLEKELTDGGVTDKEMIKNIKTALKDLIDDAGDGGDWWDGGGD